MNPGQYQVYVEPFDTIIFEKVSILQKAVTLLSMWYENHWWNKVQYSLTTWKPLSHCFTLANTTKIEDKSFNWNMYVQVVT